MRLGFSLTGKGNDESALSWNIKNLEIFAQIQNRLIPINTNTDAKGVNTSEIHWLQNLLWRRLISSENGFGTLILTVFFHMFQEHALIFNAK